jgi:hypothetical protein
LRPTLLRRSNPFAPEALLTFHGDAGPLSASMDTQRGELRPVELALQGLSFRPSMGHAAAAEAHVDQGSASPASP